MKRERLTVLVVEDDAEEAARLARELERAPDWQVTVVQCASVAEAVEELAEGGADAAFLDFSLPDARGFEALDRLRAAAPGLPVIVLTSRDETAFLPAGDQRGPTGWLSKAQAHGSTLIGTLREVVAEGRLRSPEDGLRADDAQADGVIVVDERGVVKSADAGAARLLGRRPLELAGTLAMLPVAQGDDATVELIRPDGATAVLRVRTAPAGDAPNGERAVLMWEVAGEERRGQGALGGPYWDGVTGLHDYRTFQLLCEAQFSTAKRTGSRLLLLYVRLDNWEDIGRRLGRAEADTALMATAQAMKETFRESDILARLGNNEFGALGLATMAVAGTIMAERFARTIQELNDQRGEQRRLEVRMGFARYHPGHACTLETLVGEARRAADAGL